MIQRNVLILGVLGFACLGVDQPPKPDSEVNLREACRRIVGGDYLTTYDELESSKQLELRLHEKEGILKKELAKTQKALATKQSKQQAAEYNAAELDQIDDLKAKVDLLTNNLNETTKALMDSRKAAERASQRHAGLKSNILKVFKIEKLPTIGAAYPWQVNYISTCPKYRAQCPLPEAHKVPLRDVAQHLSDPEACLRYSQLNAAKP